MKMRRLMTGSKEAKQQWENGARGLVKLIQNKYPSSLSSALEEFYAAGDDDAKLLTEVASLPLQFRKCSSSNISLLLAVNHAETSIRRLAIKQLVSLASEEGAPDNYNDDNNEAMRGMLLSRLQDDDEHIVNIVLELKEKLARYIDAKTLLKTLLTLLRRHALKKQW